jgi:hypothetical protein
VTSDFLIVTLENAVIDPYPRCFGVSFDSSKIPSHEGRMGERSGGRATCFLKASRIFEVYENIIVRQRDGHLAANRDSTCYARI